MKSGIKGLCEGGSVREVWLSHRHEDHFLHLDLLVSNSMGVKEGASYCRIQ